MIKFFRQIRQRLLAENRFSKYLIYACGEIILVMIGILLAFQVNTWRDASLEKKKETKIIGLLLNDLKGENFNLKLFSNKLKADQENLISLNLAINELETDSLKKYIPRVFSIWNYRSTKPTYDGLVQNNSLDIVKNDSLRSDLVFLFDEMYAYLDDLRENYKNSNQKLQESFKPYFFREYSPETKRWSSISIKNTTQLQNDVILKHHLGKYANRSRWLMRRIDSLFLIDNAKVEDRLNKYLLELKEK